MGGGRHGGRVLWYDEALGFGFVELETGERVFVHHRDLGGMILSPGDRIECTLGEAGQGVTAQNVMRIYTSTMG